MRTKSLVLGALPTPGFESTWVSLVGADEWTAVLSCHPVVEVSDEVELEIMTDHGYTFQVPMNTARRNISGRGVRARFLKEIIGVKSVSIILEAE